MKRFLAAHRVLTNILNDNVSFSLALRNEFNNEKNKIINRHDVTNLVGCSLRHHLIFNKLVIEKYPEINNEQFAYLSIALSNHLFVKVEDSKKVNKEFERLSVLKDINTFVSSINPNEILPNVDKNDVEYLSYRYNTPLWLVRMWKKHYKDDITLRLLVANSHPADKFYMVKDTFDFSNGFNESKIPGVYKKVTKDKIDTSDLLVANPVFKYAIDKLDIDPLRGLLIYTEVASPILNHLYHFLDKHEADYLAGSPASFFEGKRLMKELGLPKLNVYECPSSAIITVASKPVHTLIVLPENSHYSLLRERPDYFLNIKQEDLDKFIENETKTLQNAAEFVEEGGQLLYLIDTVSKKESYNLINAFVRDHPEFEIEDQKQYLPCNSLGTSCYFAILKKKVHTND